MIPDPENGETSSKSNPAKLRYEVLSDIFRFEEDLSRHTVIENQILIPLVEKLEKNG